MGANYIDYTWERQRDCRIIFPVIVECPPVHMEYIHPWKQRIVKDIHMAFCGDKRICSAVLFGSSANLRCTMYSDCDIAVRLDDGWVLKEVKNEISEKIQEICSWNADILWYDELNPSERIYENVLKGVQII